MVLVSPMPFEKVDKDRWPDLSQHNADVAAYSSAIGGLAKKLGLSFINLGQVKGKDQPLTDNGWQLNDHGHQVIAERIVAAWCDAVGIDPRVLADIEGRVHGSVALALWAEAARRTGGIREAEQKLQVDHADPVEAVRRLAEVTFDGTSSTDPDGTVVSWNWDFGDGATSSSSAPAHVFNTVGTYEVSLAVTDDDGDSDSATVTVSVVAD